MKKEQRMINGKMETVNIYNEMEYEAMIAKQEYDTAERRNLEHANRVASQLAKNREFTHNLGKFIASEQSLAKNLAADIVSKMCERPDLIKELAHYIAVEMEDDDSV